jgi:DNA-binding winged helix-turn-helix (wHTH) protein
MTKRFYEFGPFRIDRVNHVLLRDGKVLPLKPKVFDTLLVLVEAHDRVLDKDEMMSGLGLRQWLKNPISVRTFTC